MQTVIYNCKRCKVGKQERRAVARSHGEPAERDFTVNLREAKQLTRFSQFRRPSTNGHDNGFRRYVVTDTSPDGLMAQDQHGYSVRVDFAHPDKAFLKTLERVDGPLSFEWILNRDVPTIREHVQAWARQGVCAPVEIYYRHGAIAGQSIACNHDMTADGWIPAGVSIPCNVTYDAYWRFLRDRLGNVPLFAEAAGPRNTEAISKWEFARTVTE